MAVALNATKYAAACGEDNYEYTDNVIDQQSHRPKIKSIQRSWQSLDITTVLDNITNDQGTITTKGN